MAKKLTEITGHVFGMFNPRKGKPYEIWNAMDVTRDCPGASRSNRCVFTVCLYGTARHDRTNMLPL